MSRSFRGSRRLALLPGPAGEVSEVVPKIAELDLSSTLLGSWREVARLSAELPRLTLLDISRNDIDALAASAGGECM